MILCHSLPLSYEQKEGNCKGESKGQLFKQSPTWTAV